MVTNGALAGRSPLSIAAVSIYLISHLMGYPKTPKEISLVAGVSDGTIRTAYKHVYPERDILIKKEWLDRGGKMDQLPTA
jgi:transcription initiation factor TFIIB